MAYATYTLSFPPSANGMFPSRKGGGRRKSDAYAKWRTTAGWELRAQKCRPIKGRVAIEITLTPPDMRRRDASNFIKGIEDLLVEVGVLADDGQLVVRKVSAQWTEPGPALATVSITSSW